jgi:hypothetical protein
MWETSTDKVEEESPGSAAMALGAVRDRGSVY